MTSVVVTGVSRGLGLALARQLIGEGYDVIGVGRGESPDFRALIAESSGASAYVRADLGDLDALPDIARTITKEHGPIYGLVNNAAMGHAGIVATTHQSDILKVIGTNLLGPITLSKYIARHMMTKKAGRIVNISSVAAQTGFHGMAIYAASKAGIEGFSRALSRELGKYAITVNCVAPGFIETAMSDGYGEGQLESIRRRSPLGFPSLDQVAAGVSYLLSPAAATVTGIVLRIDGGGMA